jgi:hypothetical protein
MDVYGYALWLNPLKWNSFCEPILLPYTSYSRFKPVRMEVTQMFKNFSALYRMWMFTTVFTRDHHWILSWPTGIQKQGQRSPHSDWLLAGQPRGRSSSPGMVKTFLFSTSSGPALRPTQPPIQWVHSAFPGGKAAGAWSLPLTPN